MGNASKIFFALKGVPFVVYLYSHIKLMDNIKTSQYISKKWCHATFRKLRPVNCALAKSEGVRGESIMNGSATYFCEVERYLGMYYGICCWNSPQHNIPIGGICVIVVKTVLGIKVNIK